MNTTPAFLRNYFEPEKKYLKEYFQNVFASDYPESANELGLNLEKIGDPSVQMIVDSFALLAGRIRKKLDDSLPEIYESLLDLVYPDFQCPMPSIATVRFRLKDGSALPPTGRLVEARSLLESTDELGCKFQTCQPVKVWPIKVSSLNARWEQVSGSEKPREAKEANAVIDLELECMNAQRFSTLSGLESLRFFLGISESLNDALILHEMMFNDLIAVRYEGVNSAGARVEWTESSDDAVSAAGFGFDESILPSSDRTFPGYALIRELFAYPAKFLYFDLHCLDKAGKLGITDKLKVRFFLKRGPRSKIILRADSHFHLFCTPIVNLFEVDSTDPIDLDMKRLRYEVIPRRDADVDRFEVYRVLRVRMNDYFKRGGTTEYRPFLKPDHEFEGKSDFFWRMSREFSETGQGEPRSMPTGKKRVPTTGTRCFLSFHHGSGKPAVLAGSTLTVEALCTNRNTPSKMRRSQDRGTTGSAVGKSDFSTLQEEAFVVQLLDAPTSPVYAAVGGDLEWDMISLFSANYTSLVDSHLGADRLRQLLNTLSIRRSDSNKSWIASLAHVSHRRVSARAPLFHLSEQERREVVKRPVIQGIGIELEFQNRDQIATSFLLASVLNVFFGMFSSANSFTRLSARHPDPEGYGKTWRPRTGIRQFS